jgi:hypothetical protein
MIGSGGHAEQFAEWVGKEESPNYEGHVDNDPEPYDPAKPFGVTIH